MAIEYVDSTQLDTALGYTADRIRAKDGSSSLKPFDLAGGKGFGDAIDAIPSGGGGSVPHVETIDYTPAVNTQALSIPLSFANPPLFIYIYLDTEPSSPSVATVSSIRLQNMGVSPNAGTVTLVAGNRRTNNVKAGGGYDYWTSTPEGTIAHDLIDISVANKSLYFGAGLTYHIIAVEVVT